MRIQSGVRATAAVSAAALIATTLWAFAQAPGAAATQPPAPVDAPLPAMLKDYKPVTVGSSQESGSRRTGCRSAAPTTAGVTVPLDQITPKNVKQLQVAWVFSTGAAAAHEAAPLVNNGVMYVSAPGNQVIAIDAKAGTQLWRYRRELPPGAIVMHPVSRGVALYGDKVYFASNAAVLVALDARTGKEVWTATVEDNKKGYYLSARAGRGGRQGDGRRFGRRVGYPRFRCRLRR